MTPADSQEPYTSPTGPVLLAAKLLGMLRKSPKDPLTAATLLPGVKMNYLLIKIKFHESG